MSAPLGKDLLGLEQLTAEQITLVLDTAVPLKEISERTIKKVPTLRGRTISIESRSTSWKRPAPPGSVAMADEAAGLSTDRSAMSCAAQR